MKESDLLIVLTTEKNFVNAKKLASKILIKRYAACISFREIESMYYWGDDLQESKEVQLYIKTSKEKFSNLYMEINKSHSYEIPELIYWEISSSDSYKDWMKKILS